ncbi:MAG: P-II family nitrogen regulator [Candidatus Nitrosocaldus sp.]|nr:P-II family nitrogen regulator [Candidatus Nitrosocaldus sp.]
MGGGGVPVRARQGRGAGKREAIAGARGTMYYVPEFHARTTLITVVEDSKVNDVVNAIVGAASTGSPGDGKIFITNVEDVVDIGSKKRGQGAL